MDEVELQRYLDSVLLKLDTFYAAWQGYVWYDHDFDFQEELARVVDVILESPVEVHLPKHLKDLVE